MSTQGMSTRLPDLTGKVRGIVGIQVVNGRNCYTLQCENCFALETPDILVLMETHFHTRGEDRRRLCKTCRIQLFPGCNCDGCHEDRNQSIYKRAQEQTS